MLVASHGELKSITCREQEKESKGRSVEREN